MGSYRVDCFFLMENYWVKQMIICCSVTRMSEQGNPLKTHPVFMAHQLIVSCGFRNRVFTGCGIGYTQLSSVCFLFDLIFFASVFIYALVCVSEKRRRGNNASFALHLKIEFWNENAEIGGATLTAGFAVRVVPFPSICLNYSK